MTLGYDRKPRSYAEDTEQNLIVRTGKSGAEVTDNKRLRSRHCTIEATERHETSRGLSATAELLVLQLPQTLR